MVAFLAFKQVSFAVSNKRFQANLYTYLITGRAVEEDRKGKRYIQYTWFEV